MKYKVHWVRRFLGCWLGTLFGLAPGLCWGQYSTNGTLYTIQSTGPASNRVDVVFFAEGYTTNDLANRFLSDVTNAMNNLFYFQPLQEYQTYCNVYAIAVPSTNSGSTHPYYDETNLTFFNSMYDPLYNFIIEVPFSGLQKMTNLETKLMPQCGLPIILVNDTADGGAGGPADIISRGPTQASIEPHETGHTLGRLEDEYEYGYADIALNVTVAAGNTAKITNTFTNLAWSPTITNTYPFLTSITWGAWITNGTIIPTTNGAVGVYLGANYSSNNWYRCQNDCMMRTLGSPFCAACTETLVKAIYGKTRPVDSYSPATNGTVNITGAGPVAFTLTEPQPLTHSLTTQWYTNGVAILGATNATFDFSAAQFTNYSYKLQAIVSDGTGLVRNDPSNLLTETVTWNLTSTLYPPPDTNPPTLNILTPLTNSRYSNAVVNISGTATDNVAVASVWCRADNGAWVAATGTTSWSASLAVTYGTNVLQAYAVDTSGNFSPTSSVSFLVVLSAPLTVQTNGLGVITPQDNGQSLTLGQSYSLAASAGSGFVFSNWTGGLNGSMAVLTNGATVSFVMQSNLTLQANFLDDTRPTINITNLSAGQRLTNGAFTIRGYASDNWMVSNVWYSCNGSAWANAAGTTNWSASVGLAPGTNSFQAFASDNSGNVSLTNSLNCQFVVTNPLTIWLQGRGTISPNDSNAWLEVGRNYSVTASAGSGFVFSNWLGGVSGSLVILTNTATVTFPMQSNLVLQANFLDDTRPSVNITSPTAGQRITNGMVNVLGTASDNWRVTNVWCQLGSGAWNSVVTTNAYTNWITTVVLPAGTNVIRAYAQDAGGNFSLTNTVSISSSNAVNVQLIFTAEQMTPSSEFDFSLQLPSNVVASIQYSPDLVQWITLTNFFDTNSPITFHDLTISNSSQRFYRAVIP